MKMLIYIFLLIHIKKKNLKMKIKMKELNFNFDNYDLKYNIWNYDKEKDNLLLEKIIIIIMMKFIMNMEYILQIIQIIDFKVVISDHHILRQILYKSIPIKIYLNKTFVIKGNININIITANGNASYTIFSLLFESFFVIMENLFNNLFENVSHE